MRSTTTIVVTQNISSARPTGEDSQVSYPFKLKRQDSTGEGSPDPSSQEDQAKGTPGGDAQGIGCHTQTHFLNPNPFLWWYGVENIAKVRINGERCMALLNNGVQLNTIMPSFVKEHSLNIGPLSDLVGRRVTCVGLGNVLTRPLGYIIIGVQVDGVQGYGKDQIALVIPDWSNFTMRVPVILGTPTIRCPWVNA